MAVLLAALFLLQSVSPVPAGPADRDATDRDTVPGNTLHAVGIARPDTVLPLQRVTVTATRSPAVTTAEAPARVTVLGRQAIEETQSTSVADLLEARSGAFVRRYGSGGLATLSLRGAGASQSLILLDGHRIADPQLGQLDLSLLPTLLLESVEVMHGSGSALYGTDAIGGVVNLHTRTANSAPALELMAQYGAYGERSGSLLASGRDGAVSGLLLGEYRRAEGDFPYTSKVLLPPREVHRRNADRRRLTLFSTGRYVEHGVHVQGGAWYTGAERGLPGTAATAPTGERQWDEALRFWAGSRLPTPWGPLHLGGLLQHKQLRYKNPQQGTDDTGRTLIGSLRAEMRTTAGRHWHLASGLTGGYGRARHPSLVENAHEWRTGAFARATGRYGPLLLFPMLRTDAYFPRDGETLVALSPKLGANLEAGSFDSKTFLGKGTLHLKASAGRAFRRPTFNDRFWQPSGNPNLAPERGWSADVGLALDQSHRQVEVTVFGRRMRDEIVWQPSKKGYYAPVNIRRVRALGLEASLRQQWQLAERAALSSGIFYTFTDARNRSDPDDSAFGAQLRYVPFHQLKAQAHVAAGPFTLNVSGRYTGERYANSDGTRPLDPFAIVDAGLGLAQEVAGIQAELSLRVENVLNTDYAILQNRPLPPRHAQLQLTLGTGGP